MSGSLWSEPAVPAGQAIPDRDTALFVGVGPGFLSTMQIPLFAGRDFTDLDSAESASVAIVNERYAQRFLDNENPVGRHLTARVRGVTRDLEIIGLVKNTNVIDMRSAPRAIVYVSYAQLTGNFPTTIAIRVSGPPGRIASDVQRSLQAKLPDVPIEVQPLAAQVDATLAQERMMATLAGAFGMLALVVATVGLYGLLAYVVVRRTKEIGIRIALGAERTRIFSLVLGNAVRLVMIGTALGIPAAWAAARWVDSMLFGLSRSDPLTVAGALLTLTSAALIAAFLPARKAARVDPLTCLRHD
jgi:predicted permease